MPLKIKKFKAAAISAAPVYLNREASIKKACDLIAEASRNGAQLIALPEVFIPGYPHWLHLLRVDQGNSYQVRLLKNAVEVPSEGTDQLCLAAKKAGAIVVIGMNERDPVNWGTLYNTNLLIDHTGCILGKHRKIMPTLVEKICWGFGDGTSLRVYDTEVGKIGTLICGENTNPLAKFALLAQGEQIHIANYPCNPTQTAFNLVEGIEIRSRAMCFEGKVFTITASSVFSDEIRDMICLSDEHRDFMSKRPCSYTAIHDPNGNCLAGPISDRENIVYAEIDLEKALIPKLRHDVAGHYNRFDIMWLSLNRRRQVPISESPLATGGHGAPEEDGEFIHRLRSIVDGLDDIPIRAQLESLLEKYGY